MRSSRDEFLGFAEKATDPADQIYNLDIARACSETLEKAEKDQLLSVDILLQYWNQKRTAANAARAKAKEEVEKGERGCP